MKKQLHDALCKLGPSGFYFEQYLAGLFAAMGYETVLPEEYQGSCVKHEVDIAAKKDGKIFAIEAKFRNTPKDIVHLKDVMASYARYLDLLDGAARNLCPKFAQFWIVTNTSFSERSMTFGTCKGMPLIGWDFPSATTGLANMIDKARCYPITMLPDVTPGELAAFAKADIMTCGHLTDREAVDVAHHTDLLQGRVEELVESAAALTS